MRLVTPQQMREIDRRTIEDAGISGIVLMEAAGRRAAETIARRFEAHRSTKVLVICGSGNNGGDGFVVARILSDWGWRVQVVSTVPEDSYQGDASLALGSWRKTGSPVTVFEGIERTRPLVSGSSLIIDALLGTGITRDVSSPFAELIDLINESGLPVVALDIPSGVDGRCGRICGNAVQADLTVTFAFGKTGLLSYPGAGKAGRVEVVDIGIPDRMVPPLTAEAVDADAALRLLPVRPAAGHKGTFGHLLVVAGGIGKAGAAALVANGAHRAGAGLVTVATSKEAQQALAVKLTESMTMGLPADATGFAAGALDAVLAQASRSSALVIGPGIGLEEGTRSFVKELVEQVRIPVVLDADALTLIAGDVDSLRGRAGCGTILTPHPGEMARLTGATIADIEANRIDAALDLAQRAGAVVLLKGARTVIAAPDGSLRINTTGNPGLAAGGSGDVLSGIIGGCLAQGMTPLNAATLGAWLHGAAADRLAAEMGECGYLAGEVADTVPRIRKELTGGKHAEG